MARYSLSRSKILSFTVSSKWPFFGWKLSMFVCVSGSWHWWKKLRCWSQLGQLVDWPILGSSCSLYRLSSQRLISASSSERLHAPSNCWSRYFGDDWLFTKTLRGGTFCTSSDDGAQILSEWGWVDSTWSSCSQSAEECPNFLFSRNCCLRLAFLLRVLGDLYLTLVGVRAEVMALVPLLSKEQEKDPEVSWKLKPISWLTSAWMKAKHSFARDGLSFPLTWGWAGAILVVWSRRDFRWAHAALRVKHNALISV